MNVKNKKFINVQRRVMACVLAVLTAFTMNTGVFDSPDIVDASSGNTLTEVKEFGYTGSVQTYVVPEDGKYTVELAGGAGGDAKHFANYLGGKGGLVKFTADLKKGQTLYLYVGNVGKNDGHLGYTLADTNGTMSYGGNASGRYAATGGGATEVRLDGTSRNDIIAVAGGGGGANQTSRGGFNGLDAAIGSAGNNRNLNGTGSSAASNGAGGGGGYVGGTAGTTSSAAHGGSNFVTSTFTVNENCVNDERTAGYVIVSRLSSYQLMVDPNGGIFQNSDKVTTYALDTTYDSTIEFSFNGSNNKYKTGINGVTQSYTVPRTGYYYIEAIGASGGSDAASGGNGGYVKSYTYLTEGQTLYINVGGRGGDNVPMPSATQANAGGWNGGACPGAGGSNAGDYSGGGGGATSIAITNRGVLANYKSYKNEVLVVAGGGSGGSRKSAGEGGTVLYAGTGTSNSVANGASTGRLAVSKSTLTNDWNYFGIGKAPGTADGGGGGGGWVGGCSGHDKNRTPAGGGASFVNTSNNSICVGLTPSYNSGNGRAQISFRNDMVVLPDPTREGYTFKGWDKLGDGEIMRTVDGCNVFVYSEGLTTLTAIWEKNTTYGTLNIDPNGGYYNNSPYITTINKPTGTKLEISVPYRYGYVFDGWDFSGVQSYKNNVYTFSKGVGTLKARWNIGDANLTIDPDGGLYNGTTDKVVFNDLNIESDPVKVYTPVKTGYIFEYWDELNGSDGYLDDDGWHAGTKDAYLKAIWTPITYTIHYEPNTPEGLTVSGSQSDQVHTYDVEKALATNAEYNETNGYSIPNVKFLWWNTEPDGTGTTYKSGQVVKNLTTKQDDVITLYAQWMVTYTVEHYKENLDGTYTLADTDEYKLVPLTTWTAPLHDYPGWSQPASEPFTVGTTDTTLKFYYPLIHYKLTYDTQGGEWYEEQSDGTWISVDAPPSEYTVLTPDIHVTRPDKVGYAFLGWTGTDVPSNTLDVVIPQGSLGDRSYTAHWEAQAYDVEVPVSVLFSVGYDGYASGVFDQKGDGNYDTYGYMNNNSLFPVQVTNVTFNNESDYVFTHDKTLDETNPNIMNWRLDIQNGGEWNQYAPELLEGIDTDSSDIFWMAQNGNGHLKMNVDNAWAIHNNQDVKEKEQLGRIVWTFGIGHRNVTSRSIANME